MNKLGIKLYPDKILEIDEIYWSKNSIKHHNNYGFNNSIIKIRIIKYFRFGIKLYIKNKN